MKYWKITLLSLNIFFITAIFTSVNATAITSDLTLSAEIDFDLSVVPLNATQNGTIAITSGGVDDIRSVSDTAVSGGSTPLISTLTDMNDGISFLGSMASTAGFADAVLFSDLFIDIENSSSTTAYQLNFRVDYQLIAESNGLDAISGASVNIFDNNSLVDILIDDVFSDTLFAPGQDDTGAVSSFFDVFVDVGPLSTVSLSGAFGMDGLAILSGDSFTVSNSIQIALTGVTAITSSVPEPNVITMIMMSFMGFRLVKRLSGD